MTQQSACESARRRYAVELTTMLGKRSGMLTLLFSGEIFTGILKLMNAENPVRGHVRPSGECTMYGTLRTMMRTHAFSAEGVLLPDSLDMLLRDEHFGMRLCGTRKEE